MLASIIVAVFLVSGSIVEAATHYIRDGGTASTTGTGSCNSGGSGSWETANACDQLPTTLVRGDTYCLADGNYTGKTLSTAVSGTTLITIKKATVADHCGQNTGWVDTYGDGQAEFSSGFAFSTSYWTIDGVTGGGPGQWDSNYGFFGNMPASGGQANYFSFGSGVTTITVQHFDVYGRGREYASDTDIFYVINSLSDLTIRYCRLRDASRTMILTWPADATGITIEYTKFARNGTAEHREAWSAGTDSNVIVRYNLFEDIMGTGVIAIVNGTGTASNWEIYGNIMYWTGNYQDGVLNSGAIVTRYDPTCPGSGVCVSTSNWKVYNNVIANINNPGSGGARDVQIGQYDGSCANGNSIAVTNNIWYNNGSSTVGMKLCTVDTTNTTAPSGNPFADAAPWTTGNWALDSALAGTDLGASYNLDMLGSTRGDDGTWDRGAIEFCAGGCGGGGGSSTGGSMDVQQRPSDLIFVRGR